MSAAQFRLNDLFLAMTVY